MQAILTEEQVALRDVASAISNRGRTMPPSGWAQAPESEDATEALMNGFAGLGVPESAGGSGGGLVELSIVLHELGRRLVSSRYVPHVIATQLALGAGLDVSAASNEKAPWTFAVEESRIGPVGPWSDLGGTRKRVPHAASAKHFVTCLGEADVAILTQCRFSDDSEVFDLTRPTATVKVVGEPVARASGATLGLRRAWVLSAAELAGVGRGAVELAAEYAKFREQFGKPIGQFQGVAHRLADAMVAVENAWSLVLYASWAVEVGAHNAASAAHLAKASASEAAVFAAESAVQVHGGIGVTWEALPHVYLRRAITGASQLGTLAWHREQAGRIVLAGVRKTSD